MTKWTFISGLVIRCVHASLYEGLSVGPSVGPSVRGPSVPRFFRIADFEWKWHRIIGKVETLFLECNNLQKKFYNKILKQNSKKTKFKNKIFKTIF